MVMVTQTQIDILYEWICLMNFMCCVGERFCGLGASGLTNKLECSHLAHMYDLACIDMDVGMNV